VLIYEQKARFVGIVKFQIQGAIMYAMRVMILLLTSLLKKLCNCYFSLLR
jgi:hypothetical protein